MPFPLRQRNKEIVVNQNKKTSQHVLNLRYIGMYTAVFIVCITLCLIHFILNHKSLIFYDLNRGGDGLVIHYNSFLYYGRYLRSIVRETIKSGHITVPMWDMSIGYGQDVIQTLWFYAVGDPFAFLSAFIPTKYSEFGYCMITVLELYCAGLSFSYFSLYKKNSEQYTLIGALIYTMSSYPLFIVTLHPYFSLPMIFLPLLLVGVDRLIEKRYSIYYIVIIALSALADFYFFYMLCIFVFLYAILQYVTIIKRKSIKSIASYGMKFLLNSLLGIGLSAVLCLPVIDGLMGSSRVQTDNAVPLLYPLNYYKRLFIQIIGGGATYYNYLGYTAIGLICLVVLLYLFICKRKHIKVAVSVLVLIAFICLPIAAHVFNGFAYITNRWIWGFGFVCSYAVVRILPELQKLTKREWLHIVCILVLYSVIALLIKDNRHRFGMEMITSVLVSLVIISIARWRFLCNTKCFNRIITILAVILIAFNAHCDTAPNEGNYIQYFGERGQAYKNLVLDAPGSILNGVDDSSVYRFDTVAISEGVVKRNSNMILRKNGTSHYYSTNSGNLHAYVRDMGFNNSMEQTYTNLDRRTFMEGLIGVKYVVVLNGNEDKLPYGYDKLILKTKNYSLYQTDHYIPIAFLTDRLIDKNTYSSSSPIEKQQMLLQGIVVDDASDNHGRIMKPQLTDKTLNYSVIDKDGVAINKNCISVLKQNGTIDIKFDNVKDEELYCEIIGLDYQDTFEDEKLLESSKREPYTSTILVFESEEEYCTQLHYLGSSNPYYGGTHDYLVNLGYSKADRNTVRIRFVNPGEYTFDSIKIQCQPMENYNKDIVAISSEETVPILKVRTNRINIETDASKDEYLFLSILDSSGWSAFVDNKEEDIITADSSFMAVAVPKGKHHITLYYETPMLKAGLIVSVFSCIILIILILIEKKHRRQEKVL